MTKPWQTEMKNLRRYRTVLLAGSILVFLLIIVGGVLRVTNSGGACLDWPLCMGQWTPPSGSTAATDYIHRVFSLLPLPVLVYAAGFAWRNYRDVPRLSLPVILSTLLFLLQIILGGAIALYGGAGSPQWMSALHMVFSFVTLGGLLVAVLATYYEIQSRKSGNEINSINMLSAISRSSLLRLALATGSLLFILLLSGTVLTNGNTNDVCAGWPLCGDGAGFPESFIGWLHLFHRFLVLSSAVLVVWLTAKTWRSRNTNAPLLVTSTSLLVLFSAQALLGAKLVEGYPVYLLGIHQATSVAAWGSVVLVVVIAYYGVLVPAGEKKPAPRSPGIKHLIIDFLMLTKPIVVLLLLVTTYAGMVIGARTWPSLSLTFWTLLGGFLAAGGSGAINQYIDRSDDGKMQRTQKRPIPAGRLTPAEGLAFGVGAALISFYIMVAFVNFLAALLTLAGIIYYVLIYSIYLKKTTVQNIVIGGGAGAIPPLVGWAAATGSLNVPALFLFAVVFMWTPPHFWALALVRRKDYARAGVPMLPVVRGEEETRWQIFIYTAALVALTLLLPVFGLGGAIYFVGAALLGIWLLWSAWKVWKQGGNKLSWKMYRYSSMYLAFIFFVLMVDRLV